MIIHSTGQIIFSFAHIEGIILGSDDEVDEVVGGASGMCVNRIDKVTELVKDWLLGIWDRFCTGASGMGRSQGWNMGTGNQS